MKLRAHFVCAFLLCSTFVTNTCFAVDIEPDNRIPASEYLDGFVGLGIGIVNQASGEDAGTRYQASVEFARLRRWISIQARVGFGDHRTDVGGVFRIYKHWRFDTENSTGISLGAGIGGIYCNGRKPPTGMNQEPYIEAMFNPFVRYIWDWGTGQGVSFEFELQMIPLKTYPYDTSSDIYKDNKTVRLRAMGGVSFLFEMG